MIIVVRENIDVILVGEGNYGLSPSPGLPYGQWVRCFPSKCVWHFSAERTRFSLPAKPPAMTLMLILESCIFILLEKLAKKIGE